MKLVRLDRKYWPRGGYGHWCPGCNGGHEIDTERANSSGSKWTFDGDMERPTFSPSINLKINTPDMGAHYQPGVASTVCHYFIRAGQIQFLGDCTHDLRGKTVPMPDIPDGHYLTSKFAMSRGVDNSDDVR
jgi:hypothetical protein